MRAVSSSHGVMLGIAVIVAAAASAASAQDHTLVLLSHTNHTVYEVDPATGRILHEFVAPDQAHEAAISADGRTIFASVPMAALVVILDGNTWKEKGRIESEYFKRSPLIRPGRNGGPPGPPITSASPHGMALKNEGIKL